jgi:hypothetical protein
MASTIIVTTGVPGTGKTYIRCARFLVDDFLIHTNGIHYSNFPVFSDVIAKEVARRSNLFKSGYWAKITAPFRLKQHTVTEQEIRDRIKVIPDHVLQAWKNEQSGPWEYFQGVDLKYCHIAIDEIHNFIPAVGGNIEYIKKWADFLGEVRHRGCTVEALTQSYKQVNECLMSRCGLRYELIPAEDLRDPFFNIQMADWYQLKAGFLGTYHKTVFEKEKQLRSERWILLHTRRFLITPDYFQYYNSYNASLQEKENGEVNENRAPLMEYQKRTKLSLVTWFCLKNIWTLAPRVVIFFFCVWLFFFGGFVYVLHGFMSGIGQISKSQKKTSQVDSKQGLKSSDKTKSKASAAPGAGQEKEQQPVKEQIEFINCKNYNVSKFQPENEIIIYAGDVLKTEAEFKELKKELEELKRENAKGYVPVYFSDSNNNEIILKNGMRVYENYEFSEGQFKGKKVKFISLKDRYYQLDDNRIIRMLSLGD